jgi:purine/pyrimidine-nucleoside phosphorylase
MSQFENVTIIKEANSYFDGKVTSRTVVFADGEKKTLGVMLPGEYTFGTGDKEIMEIMQGSFDLQLPGEEWQKVRAPFSFEVPANSKFSLKVETLTDYCCSYIHE